MGGTTIADLTLTAKISRRFDLQAGVRNALNKRYEDPIYLDVDRIGGQGREAYLRLVCLAWE